MTDTIDRQQALKVLRQRIGEFPIQYFATLASNLETWRGWRDDPVFQATGSRAEYMRDKVKLWDAKLCRELLGKHWKRKVDERPLAHVFVEKEHTNIHYHLLLWGVPDRDHFEQLIDQMWTSVMPHGTTCTKSIYDLPDLTGYVTKMFRRQSQYDKMACFDNWDVLKFVR